MGTKEIAIPKDAGEVLRDKLRGAFLEAMPDGQLDQIIKDEWAKFFDKKTPPTTFYYSSRDMDTYQNTSPCVGMIRTQIKEYVRNELKAMISKQLDDLAPWNPDKTFVASVIDECRDSLARAVFTQFVESAATHIRNLPHPL